MGNELNREEMYTTQDPKEYFERLKGGAEAIVEEIESLGKDFSNALLDPTWADDKAPIASSDIASFLNHFQEGVQSLGKAKSSFMHALDHYNKAEKNGDMNW